MSLRRKPSQPERRDKGERWGDKLSLIGDVIAIACMIGFFVIGYFEVARIGRDETRRVADLRASCLRGSARTASDVNLNWIYYESETKLAAGPASKKLFAQLHALSAPEQAFLLTLATSGNPSRKVLQVRARADYNAARIKAQTIDYRDANLVQLHTALGSGAVPRQWVRRAHFDCRLAYH